MVGTCRAVVIRLMAGVAVSRRAREDVIDVARGAGNRDVRTGQWERRVVVIEYRT